MHSVYHGFIGGILIKSLYRDTEEITVVGIEQRQAWLHFLCS